jgi:hypothetical protein
MNFSAACVETDVPEFPAGSSNLYADCMKRPSRNGSNG